MKLVIVGAGLTGSILRHTLAKQAPGITIQIWDKARGMGGRYNTTHLSTAGAEIAHKHVDLGAQYVTAFEPEAHGHYYQILADNGVLKEISHTHIHGGRGSHTEQQHWSVPAGMASIPSFFLNGAEVSARQLQRLDLSAEGTSWVLVDADGKEERADAVVLTCPIPQVLGLDGSVQATLEPFKAGLEKVSYSSRYALGICYGMDAWAKLEHVEWSGKYFTPADSDVIVWISISGLDAPRTPGQGAGPTVVVHTTVPWGVKNKETPKEAVQATIMEHLGKLLPELADAVPLLTTLLHWDISQVYKGYKHDDEVRPAALKVSEGSSPLLLLAGDSFTKSGFDGCIDSAEAACAAVANIQPASSKLGVASAVGVAEQNSRAAM